MKKLWIPLLVITLAVLVLAGALIYLFVALPGLRQQAEQTPEIEFRSVQDYLTDTWADYAYESLEDGVLTLAYALPGTYEQLKAHGVDAGYDAVAAGHLETAAPLILRGCDIECNVVLREIVIRGISSDGQEVYRASTLTGVTACWD